MTTMQAIQTPSIDDRIMNLVKVYSKGRNEVRELQEKLKIAEANVRVSTRDVVFMQRMAQIAGYDQNITEWKERYYDDYNPIHENEWAKYFELKVATLEFQIAIYRKRNLKKFKHVVQVRGTKLTLSDNINAVGDTCREDKYVEYKYKDEVLEKKFVTLEDAHAFVEQWKVRLESDHADTLHEQRELYRQLKDQGLVYDHQTAREMSYKRSHNDPLTCRDEIGIITRQS
ncbi:hypothetical protein [Paenibacillus glucanolyticus]|uniref:hypothetical protein n=1 Tax=Paenibacillus glucanolyticus TaxID=59843 RepID=UPI00096EEF9C|nr:hypothetical protein [Paenibacillus glucanolyticus]OMF76695.1 hypothetical protein BK142_14330 [Paenibacillus glucanolyticus]